VGVDYVLFWLRRTSKIVWGFLGFSAKEEEGKRKDLYKQKRKQVDEL